MPRTITFQPSKQMGNFIEQVIEKGDYSNQSEVIRAALRLLQEQNANSNLTRLRSLIDEGDESQDAPEFDMEVIKVKLDNR